MTLIPRGNLVVPVAPLGERDDAARKILGGAVFVLDDVKKYVDRMGNDVFNFATDKASRDMRSELEWRLDDLRGFIRCLDTRHYRGSEWCYGSGTPKIAFPADVYIMGYSRVRSEEWPQITPWNYFKFSFSSIAGTLEIFSIHPETI